jgi:protein transport protein SEC61 subunit alpha
VRILDLVKPFLPVLPEVELPYQRILQDEKLIWTVCTGLIFFVLSELPLYGASSPQGGDPLFWLRPILASTRGSLMEVGLAPIVSSAFVLQLLGGVQFIDVNFDLKSDRQLFQSAQKILAILLTIASSLAILFSGSYGSPAELGASKNFFILYQLVGGGLVVILLDEVLQKGYGYFPGISFFIVLHVTQQFIWRALSLSYDDYGQGTEYVGAISSLVHFVYSRGFKFALIESFFRVNLPNMFEIYGGIAMFGVAVYLSRFRVDIPIKSSRMRSPTNMFPVALLYTGCISILATYSFLANLFLASSALYAVFPYNLLVRLFGTWDIREGTSHLVATSGLAYYLQPPFSVTQALWDPIKTLVFAVILTVSSAVFAKTWADISGSSPRDIAKLFKDQGIVIVGHRDVSVVKELKRVIPVAASVGGAVIAAVSILSDLFGGDGRGAAILVATISMFNSFEILAQETGSTSFNL